MGKYTKVDILTKYKIPIKIQMSMARGRDGSKV